MEQKATGIQYGQYNCWTLLRTGRGATTRYFARSSNGTTTEKYKLEADLLAFIDTVNGQLAETEVVEPQPEPEFVKDESRVTAADEEEFYADVQRRHEAAVERNVQAQQAEEEGRYQEDDVVFYEACSLKFSCPVFAETEFFLPPKRGGSFEGARQAFMSSMGGPDAIVRIENGVEVGWSTLDPETGDWIEVPAGGFRATRKYAEEAAHAQVEEMLAKYTRRSIPEKVDKAPRRSTSTRTTSRGKATTGTKKYFGCSACKLVQWMAAAGFSKAEARAILQHEHIELSNGAFSAYHVAGEKGLTDLRGPLPEMSEADSTRLVQLRKELATQK